MGCDGCFWQPMARRTTAWRLNTWLSSQSPQAEIQVMHAQPLPVKADIFGHTMGPIAYLMPSMPILADLSTSSHQAELQKHKGASHSRRDETDLGSCGSQDKGGNSGRRPCFSNSDVFSIARDRPDRSRDARTQCD
jgi:hypothetical protein